jgi:hypothetical protein
MNRNTFLKGVTLAAPGGVSESMLALSHYSNGRDRHAPDKPKSPRATGKWESSWIERRWDDAGALAKISRCGCIECPLGIKD